MKKKLPVKKVAQGKSLQADGGKYEVLHRSRLKDADYNPRVISPSAFRRLKESIRRSGMIQPPVWNKRTGNIVGGHQRLRALDEVKGTQDYSLTVCMVDLSEADEIALNIRLNSPLLAGDYNVIGLDNLLERPDVDLDATGLDQSFLEILHVDAGIDLPAWMLPPEDQDAETALQEEGMEEALGEALDDADEAEEIEDEQAAILEHKRRKAAFNAQENFAQQHMTSFRVVFPSDAVCSAFLDLLGKAYTGEYVDGMALAALMDQKAGLKESGGMKAQLQEILRKERPKKLKDFTVDDIPKKKKAK